MITYDNFPPAKARSQTIARIDGGNDESIWGCKLGTYVPISALMAHNIKTIPRFMVRYHSSI